MRPDIYRVKEIGSGFLAIMAKPVSGEFIEDEFQGIAREGIIELYPCWNHMRSMPLA